MAIKLKIKSLCINLGYAESARASSMILAWHGKPFEDARAAITSFVDACRAEVTPKEPERSTCCLATLARNSKAKACETCGTRAKAQKRPPIPIDEYLASLADATVDGFNATAHPFDPDGGPCDGSSEVGGWHFFESFPRNCDVVVVESLDYVFRGSGRMDADFSVIHVGKAATRASARGEFSGKET